MKRALRIAGSLCMLVGVILGVPFVVAGAMLHARADKKA